MELGSNDWKLSFLLSNLLIASGVLSRAAQPFRKLISPLSVRNNSFQEERNPRTVVVVNQKIQKWNISQEVATQSTFGVGDNRLNLSGRFAAEFPNWKSDQYSFGSLVKEAICCCKES